MLGRIEENLFRANLSFAEYSKWPTILYQGDSAVVYDRGQVVRVKTGLR